MQKINLQIDVNLINKDRLELKSFVNKEGVTKTQKNLKVTVIPLKETKVIASGDTWELVKVGFITETPTKQENEAKTKMPIIGSATQFRDLNATPKFERDSQGNEIKGQEEIDPQSIPF